MADVVAMTASVVEDASARCQKPILQSGTERTGELKATNSRAMTPDYCQTSSDATASEASISSADIRLRDGSPAKCEMPRCKCSLNCVDRFSSVS
jgi:hypothetical protein